MKRVNEYAVILDNIIRNYYVLEMEISNTSLFALAHWSREPYSCFCETEKEYMDIRQFNLNLKF